VECCDRENGRTPTRTCPSATVSATDPAWTDMGASAVSAVRSWRLTPDLAFLNLGLLSSTLLTAPLYGSQLAAPLGLRSFSGRLQSRGQLLVRQLFLTFFHIVEAEILRRGWESRKNTTNIKVYHDSKAEFRGSGPFVLVWRYVNVLEEVSFIPRFITLFIQWTSFHLYPGLASGTEVVSYKASHILRKFCASSWPFCSSSCEF
jgi:hypothetical protein